MLPMLTVAEVRHANLLRVIAEAGNAARLPELIDTKPQYLSQLVRRAPDSKTGKPRELGDDLARRIERRLAKPHGWMDTQHPHAGEKTAPYAVAHNLSHATAFHELHRITKDQLMTCDTAPPLFVMALDSEALGADWPRGLDVVWSATRTPQPGKPVLVRDRHGRIHARIFEEGRDPGQWRAVAASEHFASFTGDEPGLALLAVYRGQLEPDE
jgi:hypothetical protein